MTVKGISQSRVFQVLNSNGAWALLFGKPLLKAYKAVHNYANDSINLPLGNEWVMLENQFVSRQGITGNLLANLTVDIKQLVNMSSDKTPLPSGMVETAKIEEVNELSELKPDEEWNHLWTLDPLAGSSTTHPGTEQPDISKSFEPTLLTRKTDPRNLARVEAILAEITLSQDLTPTQRETVRLLISEYAGCFTLSMSKVTPVEGTMLPLDIPRDKQFQTKIHQRPQSLPQKEFFNGVINKMLAADIIRPISHQDVKCCAATTLAKKTHEGGGVTLNTLKHHINDECVTVGYLSAFENLPPKEETHLDITTHPVQNKWQVCQDFAELNQVTKVLPMPQGDIRLKQQNLSSHRWVTVFDFANGFYACKIKAEDQPYVCFYVEGRGYFVYTRMPFNLTGAPSFFGETTAKALGDFIGTLIELFVDDGGLAGNDFETMLANTRKLLQRISDTGLSLPATKSKFFMTEATFAGGRVGPDSIKPDLTKLTAIADWKTPKDLQNLGSFLGLTGPCKRVCNNGTAADQSST